MGGITLPDGWSESIKLNVCSLSEELHLCHQGMIKTLDNHCTQVTDDAVQSPLTRVRVVMDTGVVDDSNIVTLSS